MHSFAPTQPRSRSGNHASIRRQWRLRNLHSQHQNAQILVWAFCCWWCCASVTPIGCVLHLEPLGGVRFCRHQSLQASFKHCVHHHASERLCYSSVISSTRQARTTSMESSYGKLCSGGVLCVLNIYSCANLFKS